MKHLPAMYAVPGQHDLPYHCLEDIKQSAFWTLVMEGRITPVGLDAEAGPTAIDIAGGSQMRIWAYPWGRPVVPCPDPDTFSLDVCVSHSFLWTQGTGFPGAPNENYLDGYIKRLVGYDIVLFGDNHKTIIKNLDRTDNIAAIFNPGSFMIRTADQKDHRPCLGLLKDDGTIEQLFLDVTTDVYLDEEGATEEGSCDLTDLLAEVRRIQVTSLCFEEEIKKVVAAACVSEGVRRIVLQTMENLS